jgi:hypothetical protein
MRYILIAVILLASSVTRDYATIGKKADNERLARARWSMVNR